MEITLTDFVDFITKSGSPRMTHVRQIIARPAYEPAFDFYKGLREAVAAFHEGGGVDPSILEDAVKRGAKSNRANKYHARVEAYKRFLGRKAITWFSPPREDWEFDDLTVHVNPELGLVIDGIPTVIKLYWKETKLSLRQVETGLFLMQSVLAKKSPDSARMCILDVPNIKPLIASEALPNLTPLLRSEARAFIELWKELNSAAA